MIKAVIIDDELHAIKQLQKNLLALNTIEVVASYNTTKDTLQEIQNLMFDILFLDIEMPHLNGFEFLKSIERYSFTVVFTTAYSQYAIEAFKYAAFDFLLKPISKEDLQNCIARWQVTNNYTNTTEQVAYLDSILENPKKADKLTIATKNGYYFININEIIYCESESNYTVFHLKDNKKIIASRTLKEYESLLERHNFLRVHKSYLINKEKIFKLNKGRNYNIDMGNGAQIPIARNKQNEIRNKLQL